MRYFCENKCAVFLWDFSDVILCYVILCYYVMLVMLCYVMLCYICYIYYVILCYVMLCYVMLCYVGYLFWLFRLCCVKLGYVIKVNLVN